MAIIVEHRKSKNRYILLGSGYGIYKSSRPSAFLGNMAPKEESGELRVVALSDRKGKIHWIEAEFIRVVAVDGVSTAKVLG